MSVKQIDRVWELSEHKGTDLLVLLALADFSNDEGVSWPSIETLARKTRVSERTIQRSITKCVNSGELRVRAQQGPNGTNLYQLRLFDGGRQSDGGDKLTGVTNSAKGVTPVTRGGDTNDTRSVIDPSLDPSERDRAREPDVNPSPPGADIDDYDTQLHEMKTVLGQVVKENMFYGPHEKRIGEGAKALLQARHTPEQVIEGFAEGDTYWYIASYGSKGEKPWVKNVVGEIATAVAWANGQIKDINGKAETAFDRLSQAITKNDYRSLPEDIKATLQRMGKASQDLKNMRGNDMSFFRREFMEAYHATG